MMNQGAHTKYAQQQKGRHHTDMLTSLARTANHTKKARIQAAKLMQHGKKSQEQDAKQ
jgi:hypothetical protein